MHEVLSLRQAILATLHYFDLFDWPLTVAEIEDYLYGWSAPAEAIAATLTAMDSEISHAHGFYCLKGKESICELRREKAKLEQSLWKKVNRFSWIFALCPFLKMTAVCNSLAYGNVKNTSDIDVFVVAENGKVSTARFFLKILTQIFSMRVHHYKIAGRFCLSFFVSEKAMDLSKIALSFRPSLSEAKLLLRRRNVGATFDPHFAYFVQMMIPIYGKDTYLKFLKANESWLTRFFHRDSVPRLNKFKKHIFASAVGFTIEIFLRIFGSAIELLCQKLQARKDIERKKQFPNSHGGIMMTKDIFKFHENDPREEIAEKFMKRLELI